MKATIEFTLPEDAYDLKCAQDAAKTQFDLRDIDEWLRGLLKHGGIKEYTADRLAEEVREKLNEVMINEF